MHRKNVRSLKQIYQKYKVYLLGVIVIMWTISIILTCKVLRQPIFVEETVIQNTIEEKTTYDYHTKVKRSALYPQGGEVTPDGVIFSNLSDDLVIQFDDTFHADKPIRIEGNAEVFYRIVATDIWEREFELAGSQSIDSIGESLTILEKEISLDLNQVFDFIAGVEEETTVRANSYQLIINLMINGNIYDATDTMIDVINTDIKIPFEVFGQYIKYAGDSTEKEFTNIKTIESVNTIPQSFRIFNNKLSIINVRYTFIIISILLFIPLFLAIFKKIKNNKDKVTAISMIDTKNKTKIIEITDINRFDVLPQIGLKSFKSLLQIADDKEEPILRYANYTEGMIYYYTLGAKFIYYYSIAENYVV